MQHERSEMGNGVTPLGIALVLLGGAFALVASIGLVLVIAYIVTPALPGHVGYGLFDGLVLLVGFGACSAALFYKSRASVRPKSDRADAADNVLIQMAYASASYPKQQESSAPLPVDTEEKRRLAKWQEALFLTMGTVFLTLKTVDLAMRAYENPTRLNLIVLAAFSIGCVGAIWSLWGTIRRWRAE